MASIVVSLRSGCLGEVSGRRCASQTIGSERLRRWSLAARWQPFEVAVVATWQLSPHPGGACLDRSGIPPLGPAGRAGLIVARWSPSACHQRSLASGDLRAVGEPAHIVGVPQSARGGVSDFGGSLPLRASWRTRSADRSSSLADLAGGQKRRIHRHMITQLKGNIPPSRTPKSV